MRACGRECACVFYSFDSILLGLDIDVREIGRTICNNNNNNNNNNSINIINNNSYSYYPLLLAKCGNSGRKCVNDFDCVLCGLNQMRSDLCV